MIQLALFLVLIQQISHAFYTVGLLLNRTKIVIMMSKSAALLSGEEVFTIPLSATTADADTSHSNVKMSTIHTPATGERQGPLHDSGSTPARTGATLAGYY